MERYIYNGLPMNKFLTSVFSNNLYDAFTYSNEKQFEHLDLYLYFCLKYAPEESRGSFEKVKAWIDKDRTKELKDENISINVNAPDIQ